MFEALGNIGDFAVLFLRNITLGSYDDAMLGGW